VVALNYAQVREVLDDQFEEQEGISVRRKLNQMYSIGGTNGRLAQKVARDSLIQLISLLAEQEIGAPLNSNDISEMEVQPGVSELGTA
jgi:hypothetical protein